MKEAEHACILRQGTAPVALLHHPEHALPPTANKRHKTFSIRAASRPRPFSSTPLMPRAISPPSQHPRKHFIQPIVLPQEPEWPYEPDEREIQKDLEQRRYDTWGSVIYRTYYGDEASWRRFKNVVIAYVEQKIQVSQAPEIGEKLAWTFFDDRSAFENASKDQLRMHFIDWVQENWQAEQPRAERLYERFNRYTLFVEVDRGVLDSTPKTVNEHALTCESHVNLVNARWRPIAELDPDDLDILDVDRQEYEPIHGMTEGDIGWMKVHTYLVGTCGHAHEGEDLWDLMYTRPPDVSMC